MRAHALLPAGPVNLSRVLSVAAAAFNLARHTDAQSWMDASNLNQEAQEFFSLLGLCSERR